MLPFPNWTRWLLVSLIVLALGLPGPLARADVRDAQDAGFQLVISRDCPGSVGQAEAIFLQKLSQWWLADHTYSGDSGRLRFDLKQRCLLESLENDGFVRHMEIKQYHPGRKLVMTGGMGPLQEMGIQGAMSIVWVPSDEGCRVELRYNVSGYTPGGLKQLASVVDTVLSQQMDSYQKACHQLKNDE